MTNVPGNTSYFSFQLLSEVLLVKAQFPSRLARADTGVISEYCAAITHCTKSKSWLSILSRVTGGPWNPEAWRLIIRNNWLPPQGAPPSPSSFLLLDPEKDKTHILTHTHTHSLTYSNSVIRKLPSDWSDDLIWQWQSIQLTLLRPYLGPSATNCWVREQGKNLSDMWVVLFFNVHFFS